MDVTTMSTTDLVSIIYGIFLPPIISIVQQPKWPDWLRSLMTILICMIVAIGRTWQAHELNLHDFFRTFLVTIVFTWLTYQNFWKKSFSPGIEDSSSKVIQKFMTSSESNATS